MSAWIVSKAHIDAMVQGAIRLEIIPQAEADTFGAFLWKENHKSINARYGERSKAPPYKFAPRPSDLTPGALLKTIDCYSYQSCEHYGWEGSEAHAKCETMRAALAGKASESDYAEAPWGIQG
jgi:hypothetical protein